MNASLFVFNIIDNILNLNLTSNEYTEIEGVKCSRNVFYYCVKRNHKYLNENERFVLKHIILKKTKDNIKIKNKLLDYFKNCLSDNIKNYIVNNPDKLEKIVDLAISEFISEKTEFYRTEKIEEDIIKEIGNLYVRTVFYLDNDIGTAFILLDRMNNKIIEYIANKKLEYKYNVKNKDDLIKLIYNLSHVIPSDVYSYLIYLSTLNISKNENLYSQLDCKKLIFLKLKNILKWLFNDFISKPEYFRKLYCKVYSIYKKEDFDYKIKILTVDETGWSIENFAKNMLKVFYETIGESYKNVSGLNELVEIINHQRSTHKIILNNKNEIIGYWTFLPITDELYNKNKRGKLDIREVTPLTMPTMIPGKYYNIHFGAICLKSEYRKTQVFSKVLYSIMNVFEKMAVNEIYINEIITKACSNSGISLAESIGLKYVVDHVANDGKIYSGKIKDLLNNFYLRDFNILKSLYKN